ncbi:hypothetical protein KY321_05445, partial [Candidatus Woesearchaeota archaeon]|nr:hypothetical protein [Candidatus Woesearchaeota archaeon]
MTANPIFAAYSDNLFIPIYFSAKEGYEIFVKNKDKADYIIYSDEFPCEVYENKEECEESKEKMLDMIQNNTLVHEDEYYLVFRND